VIVPVGDLHHLTRLATLKYNSAEVLRVTGLQARIDKLLRIG